jgi:hypothetical protein
VIFISSADHNYFPMLLEWAHSVRRFPQSAETDIGILDAGLMPEQITKLERLQCKIVKPDWPACIPQSKIQGRDFLKSCVCRPFLPDYFPGYKTYFWMDADTWLQRWDVAEMFLEGAARGKIALTAQVDRAYPRPVRIKWLGPFPRVRSFYFSNARKAYGLSTAKKLIGHYVLSAGAFALRAGAPHWQAWQDQLARTVKRGNIFTAEQLSLGVICHLNGLPYENLPSWTHWLCQFKPLWDVQNKVFAEPSLPHETLGILHLSGWDDMRLNRSITTDFETLDGKMINLSYRYPEYNGETGKSI